MSIAGFHSLGFSRFSMEQCLCKQGISLMRAGVSFTVCPNSPLSGNDHGGPYYETNECVTCADHYRERKQMQHHGDHTLARQVEDI